MANYLGAIQKSTKLTIETLVDDYKARKDKDNFRPSGTQIYMGRQGQGKTMSAVHAMAKLKSRYPKAVIVSNLLLTGLTPRRFSTRDDLYRVIANLNAENEYVLFEDADQMGLVLVGVNNGKYGVIYVVDEIHTYLNATDSKNTPSWVYTEISQQRKQHKVIIGTSQLFKRAGIALREQCDNLIDCRTHLGVLTIQHVYHGEDIDEKSGTLGKLRKRGWFIQTRKIRNMYDTYQKVVSGLDMFDDRKPVEITIQSKKKFALKS